MMNVSDAVIASGCTSIRLEAVVIRADGTVEDLGVVSEWNANPAPAVVPADL